MTPFTCVAIAIHDVDGPIRCASGEKVRLQGIGALEMNGRARPGQPSVPGNPRVQRRIMATRVIGATIVREDKAQSGHAWFAKGIPLRCTPTGRSYDRITAWCRRPDGYGLSCGAIRAGVALRWAKYDRTGRLAGCRSEKRR